jgi:membrane-bound lytic murein transglycosylase D
MTKRKRVKAGLLHLFVFATSVTYAKSGEQQQPTDAQQKTTVTTAQVLAKAAVTAVLTDSSLANPVSRDSGRLLEELYNSEMTSAPKATLNAKAASFVKTFLKSNREDLQKAEKRSSNYFSTITTIFSQYGLPVELKYLAVIESKLKPSATSHAGAAGLWQLMPGTARELGLKVRGKVDERRHVYKSTVAAAKYLKSLYKMYGDWLLVLAAYNGGPGNVNKAIRNSGSRNFWKLQQFLPGESRAHVKRFIGAHYYFEQQGSVTTHTPEEWEEYQQALSSFMLARKQEREELKHLIDMERKPIAPPIVKSDLLNTSKQTVGK